MTGNNFLSSPKQTSKTAPSRGLSPVRSLSTSPQMSPVMRPKSPLSPRYEAPARFEPMRPSSPRDMTARSAISQRRGNSNSLKLPSLPRFHPSNFASTHSSLQPTPDSGQSSPQAPASPRQPHHRTISDAQKHLLAYQREMVSAARSSTPVQFDGPESPRLMPMGSPGPVTPLELESEDGGYLAVGINNAANEPVESHELVERLVKEEAAARQRRSGSRQSNR